MAVGDFFNVARLGGVLNNDLEGNIVIKLGL